MSRIEIMEMADQYWGNYGRPERSLSSYVDKDGTLAESSNWPELIDLASVTIVALVDTLYKPGLSDIVNIDTVANAVETLIDRMDTLAVGLRQEIQDREEGIT